eukprot:3971780-Pleurochrysis_carterae.AAC.3
MAVARRTRSAMRTLACSMFFEQGGCSQLLQSSARLEVTEVLIIAPLIATRLAGLVRLAIRSHLPLHRLLRSCWTRSSTFSRAASAARPRPSSRRYACRSRAKLGNRAYEICRDIEH